MGPAASEAVLNPLHIAVDAREIEGHPTGVGRVLDGLLGAWPEIDRLTLIARSQPHDGSWEASAARVQVELFPGPRRLPGSAWEQIQLPAAVRRLGADALLSPAYGMPALSPCPTAVGMHDCASEARPQDFRARERWRRRLFARIAARRAAFLFMGSEFAAREAEHRLGVPRSRSLVLPYGVEARFTPASADTVAAVRRRYGLSGRTVLFVGAHLRRRNLGNLIEIVADLAEQRDDLHLCLVGEAPATLAAAQTDAELPRWEGIAGRLGDRVRWLGYVEETDLPALYSAATLVAYPSRYEGFGLPVLEALASGTAVVAAAVGSLPEVFEDRVWLIDPTHTEQWRYAMRTLLDDEAERGRWVARASEWARGRTWGLAANRLRKRLETSVVQHKGRYVRAAPRESGD